MRVRCFRLIPLVAALVLTGSVSAQDTAVFTAGTRVRVKASTIYRAKRSPLSIWPRDIKRVQVLVGTVVSLDSDTLRFLPENGNGPIPLAVSSLEWVDQSGGPKEKKTVRGALIGTGIGMVAGLLIGSVASEMNEFQECGIFNYESCRDRFDHGKAARNGAAIGGGIGLVVGVLIGSAAGERWRRVPLQPLRLDVMPDNTGNVKVVLSGTF